MEYKLYNTDGLELLNTVPDQSIDLVLTDPPYITSRDSGMNQLANSDDVDDKYGRKYAIKTDYGEWDSNFTLELLEQYVEGYYRVLKNGGTCIIFFDIWKITNLSDIFQSKKFKQLRLIEWVKTNPVPINASINYLTNSREIAITAVKKSKPTFNSKYDKGIYEYPIYSGKDRFHPTQKSLKLFEDLVEKHSNVGDLVLDTFMGSATTAVACLMKDRSYIGSEVDSEFYNKAQQRIDSYCGLGI